jgi:hypothetical protein
MAIDLTTFFDNLGIVSGNTSADNQYEFYKGITWNDASVTNDQYEFYKKLMSDGGYRYEFFKQYISEYGDFYRDGFNDGRVADFYTFYQYASAYLVGTADNWILFDGMWNDSKIWVDTQVWID